jgi:DNA adenine methylase
MIGPISYIGGKNRLATRIIALLPEHTTYVEVFAGGAQVLFHKPPSHLEVLNDLNYDVVNFFRVCQWHYEELIRYLRYCLISRKLHAWHLASNPDTLTDIQRAGRFFFLQKTSWGGLVVKQHFHYGVTQPSNFNPKRIPEIIAAAHRRLQNVQIECLPYQDILKRYNRPGTFFFLDPPYWNRKLYKYNFTAEDFTELEQRLHGVTGKFLLTLDNHPEVVKLFKSWEIERVELVYTAQRSVGKRYGELLISNFRLPKTAP